MCMYIEGGLVHIMDQYVFMRIFTFRAGEGVPIHAQQGYAWMHAQLDNM